MDAPYLITLPVMYTDLHTGELVEPAELTAEQWTLLGDGHSELGRVLADEYGVRQMFHPHADAHVDSEDRIERCRSPPAPAATTAPVAWRPHARSRMGPVSRPLWQRLGFGAYAADAPWPDPHPHYVLERELGVRLQTMSWFLSMDTGWPVEQAAAAAASGHDLLICLEPRCDDGEAVPFTSILAGEWDEQLEALLTGAATYPGGS
jgi:hypothetical protein